MVWAICGCALGILLAAVPFIPTTQLTELSVAKYRADYMGTGGGLYWQSLVSLVAPNHYNIFDISRFNGPWDPTFLYLYSSIGGLLLAIFAIVLAIVTRRNRDHRPIRAVAAVWIVLDVGRQNRAVARVVSAFASNSAHRNSSRVHILHFQPGHRGAGGDRPRFVARGEWRSLGHRRRDCGGSVPGGIRTADEQSSRSNRTRA